MSTYNKTRKVALFIALVMMFSLFQSASINASDMTDNMILDDPMRLAGTVYESEPNNTLATSDFTYNDYNSIGALTSSTDVDWWRVSFSKSGKVNFWLGNIPSGCDYDIELYNSSGELIGSSVNYNQDPELIQHDVEAETYYYIKIYTCSGYSNSTYLFRTKWYPHFDSEVYTIKNVGNNMYLTVHSACNASSTNYAYIYTATNNSNDANENGQRMRINYNSDGYYTVAPLCSFNGQYRVLDIFDWPNDSARQLWLYPENNQAEQKLMFELQPDGTFIIGFKSLTYVLDVSSSTEKKVFANTRTGSSSQKWIISADTDYNAKEALYNTYGWQWPLTSCHFLTSSYGKRTLDNGLNYEFHNGLDISALYQNVLCPTDATVAQSGEDKKFGCGNYLIMETQDSVYQNSNQNLRLLFQHLVADPKTVYSYIYPGATISQGTTIAVTGDSGSTGSYHLHFCVISDGSNVFINDGENYVTRTFSNTEQPLMFYSNTTFTYN